MSAEPAPAQAPPSYEDQQPAVHHSNLEDFEREADVRLPFLLSYREVKLLGIAGVRPLPCLVTRPLFTFPPPLL